ncbi:VWA domain-containing protein [Aeoliella sp. ICT_H6.2]|uniref:VWA domain-containing protein n=1 Tax=Aeoliella straminimaris TaxID=2954799 RepID=A0A9X2JK91_9BACT|nr:vWA domain-containing protein [Aeoliella straminimaris]MCO6047848.1 VWA domain-containing protein [Aeoliella straminimaris]
MPDQSIDAAQQTQWQLETHWTWAPWFTVLFVVAVVLGVVYLYSRENSPAGPVYRGLLGVLRLTTIALVLVMLSELLLSATRSGLPRLVVLLDTSASMGLEQPGDARSRETRLQAARELFLTNNAELIEQWQQTYVVDFAAVADGTQRIEAGDTAEIAEALANLTTDGTQASQSRLGDAVAGAIDARQGTLPAAVVIATDGRTTAGRSLDEVRELARRRGVPIYAVGYGATNAPPDARLTNLLADRRAFVDDLVAIGVTLETTSLAGKSITVKVRDTATGNVAAEQTVNIADDSSIDPLQLVVKPEHQGETTYAIEADVVDGERDTENNRLTHVVDVRDDQVRVLLAGGYPNYEFRYLKNLLDRDSSFKLTSYMQEADLDYATQDASAIATLPVDEQALDDFDVLVLLDLNPRLLPPRWWQNVERHVAEQGGGLVLVAGPRHFPWQYASNSPIATLSPVELRSAGRAGGMYDAGFDLELTPLGLDTPAMQLGATPAESAAIWQQLPPFYWYASAENLKPAARALAVHPTARGADGSPLPLVATQYVGAGRVLYHGVDSTWRWRFRVGDVFFARYWGQTLRQLARTKLLEGNEAAEILVDREEYDLGQPVRLGLRLDGKELATLDRQLELLLTTEGQPNRRVPLSASRISAGQLQATVSDLPPGHYRVSVAGGGLTELPTAGEFTVLAPPGELADTTMNQAALKQLADATYGKFYTADTAAELAGDLPVGDRVPLEVMPPVELWNRWWMLAAITACLSTEWILRKRRAML